MQARRLSASEAYSASALYSASEPRRERYSTSERSRERYSALAPNTAIRLEKVENSTIMATPCSV